MSEIGKGEITFDSDKNEKIEQKPTAVSENWLSLRESIQEKTTAENFVSPEEQERIKSMNELITPELMSGYRQILRDFRDKTKKSEEHPQREFIDINNDEFFDSIENWINDLVNEVKNKKESGLMKKTLKS